MIKYLILLLATACLSLTANIHTVDPLSCDDITLTEEGIYFVQGGETYFAHYLLYMGNGNYVAGLRHCERCGHILNKNGDCDNGCAL